MAASGYTPISLYYSTTASATPLAANLVSGELALNLTDGKLYYKDSGGTVQLLSTSTTANGTANGVLYLNGSKVATSGSALTFDGTSLSVGTSSHPSTLAVYAATGGSTTGLTVNASGNMLNLFGSSSTNAGVIFDATDGTVGSATGVPMIYRLGGSEAMRLTSTGLGIGTSSPSCKLQVDNGAGARFYVGLSNNIYHQAYNHIFQSLSGTTTYATIDNSGNLGIGTSSPGTKLEVSRGTTANASATGSTTRSNSAFALAASSDTNNRVMFGIDTNTNGWIQVQNTNSNGTADLIINPVGGNLGLGVTPSAWGTFKAIDLPGGALAGIPGNQVDIAQNSYYTGSSWIYKSTAAATFYQQAGATHAWYNAPSGTAGNAITFTQAMTLDASGNLGIGTTSPAKKLDVNGDASIYGVTVGRGAGAVSTNTAVGASAFASATAPGGASVAIGYQAMQNATDTFGQTVAIGYRAGRAITSGGNNTLVGLQSGLAITTGNDNSAFGLFSLKANTTGSSNTAIGREALGSNTTASNNTAVGYQAGYSNVTGTEHTFVGYQAGRNTTASNNTFVGMQAAYTNTTGTSNTAIGRYANYFNTTGSYNTSLGESALQANTTASYNTAVGMSAGYNNTTGNITAIGAYTLYNNTTGTLNVAIGGADGSGAALGNNTTGSYNTAVGYHAVQSNTAGLHNTGIGTYTLYSNTTASNNTAVGYQAGYSNTTGTSLVAMGRNAALNNTTGNDITAIGRDALYSNTTGASNTALGSGALLSNTTASNNTAVGYQAAYTGTTASAVAFFGYQAGYLNTADNVTGIGSSALYNNTGADNTAVGQTALYANTSGASNTAVGRQALRYNTTASNNTAVGYQAGYSNTTGANNTFIGRQSGYNTTTGAKNTFVGGYNGGSGAAGSDITTGSANTILGSYNGNQGGLDIRTASNYIVLSDGDGNPRCWWNNYGAFANVISGSTALNFGVNPVSQFVNGNSDSYTLIVGNDAASPASQYVQDIRFIGTTPNNTNARFLACTDATNEKAAILSTGGFLSRNNSYGTYSDVKLKENIVDASSKLNDVMRLKVRNFNFKTEPETKQIGFIAQEFEQVFPSMVDESPDRGQDGAVLDTTTKSIKTSVLIPILVKAMQELKSELDSVKAELATLKGA